MPTNVTIGQLRKADIIVSTTNANISGAIRFGSGSDFSHTMLYSGNDFVIEAIGHGVVQRRWTEASSDATLAIALRRRDMSTGLCDEVVCIAETFLRRPYDTVGAAGAGITKTRGRILWGGLTLFLPAADFVAQIAVLNNARESNRDHSFFCSELVARAYQIAGIPLSSVAPTYMNPREVRMCSNLMYVGHLIS